MSLPQILSEYGYLAVFLGCMLEGETILLLAGFAAHQGYLSYPLVLLAAMSGGMLGDQFFFLLGRRYANKLLIRYPRWVPQVERIHLLLQCYHAWLIIGVRFMYGLRIIGPVAIGSSKIEPWRFLGFNLLGAAIWATLIASIGYFFGQTLHWLLADLKHYEEWAFAALGLGALIAGAWHYYRRHH